MSFETLGLCPELLRAIKQQGYEQPTPVQKEAIPVVLAGKDVLAGAQTGTGKTAGFTLPLLQHLNNSKTEKRHIRALILTPTRELAAQVEESIKTYGQYLSQLSVVIYGGVKMGPQVTKLRRGVDIVVATPGRLLDHLEQKTIDLSQVEMLVLDEADRMLDMGFIKDIQKILAKLPQRRQNLLFSATYSAEIKKLADKLLNSPVLIEVARQNTSAEIIEQRVYPVDKSRKRELLSYLIKTEKWFQVLVFTRTKHGADRLTKQLIHERIPALAIHGNKSQNQRNRALDEFKKNKVQVLVATDIAARGIDIDQLPHVVNFELPNIPEDYVHRIGRTGRAGNEGEAISLVSVDEKKFLRDIERLIKREIPKTIIDGFEPDPTIKAEAEKKSSRGNKPQRKSAGRSAKAYARKKTGNGKPGGRRSSTSGQKKKANAQGTSQRSGNKANSQPRSRRQGRNVG